MESDFPTLVTVECGGMKPCWFFVLHLRLFNVCIPGTRPGAWGWGEGPGSFSCRFVPIFCSPSTPLIFAEDEDSEGPRSGESRPQPSPNQSYLCIPFPRGEDGDGPPGDGVHEEPTPVNSATSIPLS